MHLISLLVELVWCKWLRLLVGAWLVKARLEALVHRWVAAIGWLTLNVMRLGVVALIVVARLVKHRLRIEVRSWVMAANFLMTSVGLVGWRLVVLTFVWLRDVVVSSLVWRAHRMTEVLSGLIATVVVLMVGRSVALVR